MFLDLMLEFTSLFIPNYLGHRITEKFEDLGSVAYEDTNWIDQDKQFKKNLLIMMEFSDHPMTFSIPGLFQLDLTTFVDTCNATYSFYNVLKQFNDN
jgi:hypothetical protein